MTVFFTVQGGSITRESGINARQPGRRCSHHPAGYAGRGKGIAVLLTSIVSATARTASAIGFSGPRRIFPRLHVVPLRDGNAGKRYFSFQSVDETGNSGWV